MAVGTRISLAGLIFAVMSCTALVPKYTLNNGNLMPAIALGTYLGFDKDGVIEPNDDYVDTLREAIDIGWRHFDTASVYKTEKAVGNAIRRKIKDGTVKRQDIFVTTKLWNTHHERNQVEEALRDSLELMGLDYVDLYLMHWPIGLDVDNSPSDVDYMETWRGMEDMYRLGLAKSIGVANFNVEQLARVISEGQVKPAVIQVEIHLQMSNIELVEFAQSQGVVVMGYSPFGSLVNRFGTVVPGPKFDNPILSKIAKRYNKTTSQIVLRWMIEKQVVPIPKTTKIHRLKENIDVFDFSLEKEEIQELEAFDCQVRYTKPSFWQNHPYYPFEKVQNPIANPFLKVK